MEYRLCHLGLELWKKIVKKPNQHLTCSVRSLNRSRTCVVLPRISLWRWDHYPPDTRLLGTSRSSWPTECSCTSVPSGNWPGQSTTDIIVIIECAIDECTDVQGIIVLKWKILIIIMTVLIDVVYVLTHVHCTWHYVCVHIHVLCTCTLCTICNCSFNCSRNTETDRHLYIVT